MTEQTQSPTIPNAAKLPKLDASRLPHGHKNLTPLAQLKRLQRVLFDAATAEGVENRDAAQLAHAWEKLQGRKAAMTMKAAPKPVDTLELAARKAKARERKLAGQPDDWRKGKRKASVQPAPAPSIVPLPTSEPQSAAPTQAS